MRIPLPLALSCAALLTLPLRAQVHPSPDAFKVPTIPVERYTLPNGLTVLLSEDHSSPVVSVDVGYHVGSKNERLQRTGFAHLFEHVMFQGSEHVPYGAHFKAIENMGGTANGGTEVDKTTYYETFPSNQLETVFWLESDRMGFLLPALDQTKLDAQRDVVKNERRQRVDNAPFGSADEVILAALYPPTNPYSWSVIGSMADLSAASLADVKSFFQTYYAPSNAILSVSGDFAPAATKALIAKYFGPISAGPPVVRPIVPATTLSAEKRLVLEDGKAQLPQLTIVWPTAGDQNPDVTALGALANVLTQDRTSRLTKLLVYDRQLATSVKATQETHENAGQFQIAVSPRSSTALTEIERLVDSTVATLVTTAPTVEEVDRFKNYVRVRTTIGLDGSLSKAETLLGGEMMHHDPVYYVTTTQRKLATTPADVERVARHYLTAGRIVLSMVPAGKLDEIAKPTAHYTNVTPKPEAQTPPSPSAGQ